MIDWDNVAEWRAIPGYPGYEANRAGQIRSVKCGYPRVLRQRSDRYGYRRVNVIVDGAHETLTAHRAILLAFRGEAPGMVARHLDGNPCNNALANLAWGTESENMQDRKAHGTDPNASRAACANGHEYTPENTRTRKGGSRICRACDRDRARRYYWNRKEVA